MSTTTAQDWQRTPIWDAEFADRWEQLHQELTEPPATTPAKKPRSKSTSK